MGEKRRFIRFDVLMDAICRTGSALKKVKVNNFSKEGIGILSSESLREGEGVEIELMIPGDNIPILFEGEVAWSRGSADDDASHKGGVRFKKISNNDRSRMLGYVYQKWIMPASAKVKVSK